MPLRPALFALPLLAGAVTLAAAGAGRAQPVATAASRGDELTTADQIDAWTRDAPPAPAPTRRPAYGPGASGPAGVGLGEDSPWAEGLAPPVPILPFDAPPIARTTVDGRVHGEAGAEYGNRGYGGYAVASGPLGDHGAVQVGVSDFRGTGGPRWSGWNGDHKTLSVGAVFDFSRDHKPAADPAAPGY